MCQQLCCREHFDIFNSLLIYAELKTCCVLLQNWNGENISLSDHKFAMFDLWVHTR